MIQYTPLIIVALILIGVFSLLVYAAKERARMVKQEERVRDMEKTFCSGNILMWYGYESVKNGVPDPFNTNVYFAHIVETRNNWVLYELQEFAQKPGHTKKLMNTTFESSPCEKFYEKLQVMQAKVVKDCNPK